MSGNLAVGARGRRTAEQTRGLLLEAGVDLLLDLAQQQGDAAVSAALAHLRVTAVAERATRLVRDRAGDPDSPAVTTGAVYNLWSSQTDYQIALLLHVTHRQGALAPSLAGDLTQFPVIPPEATLAETVRAIIERILHHHLADPMLRIELAFLIGVNDPRVRDALAARRERFAVAADEMWAGVLRAHARRLRAPCTERHLTTAVAGLLIGTVVLWHADPTVVDDPHGRDGWSMPARAAVALVEACTEPAPRPSPA